MIWETRREEDGLLTVLGDVGSCRAGYDGIIMFKQQTLLYTWNVYTYECNIDDRLCTSTLSGHWINMPIAGRKGRLFTSLQDTLIGVWSSKCHLLMSLHKVSGFMLIALVVIINRIRSIKNLHCQMSRLLVCQVHGGLLGEPFGLISGLRGGMDVYYNWREIRGCNEM